MAVVGEAGVDCLVRSDTVVSEVNDTSVVCSSGAEVSEDGGCIVVYFEVLVSEIDFVVMSTVDGLELPSGLVAPAEVDSSDPVEVEGSCVVVF